MEVIFDYFSHPRIKKHLNQMTVKEIILVTNNRHQMLNEFSDNKYSDFQKNMNEDIIILTERLKVLRAEEKKHKEKQSQHFDRTNNFSDFEFNFENGYPTFSFKIKRKGQ